MIKQRKENTFIEKGVKISDRIFKEYLTEKTSVKNLKTINLGQLPGPLSFNFFMCKIS